MTVYIIDLESIPTRYTCEWKTFIPQQLKEQGLDVVVIEGPIDLPDNTTPGMFLNFAATNIYKSAQIEKISRLISENKIKDGDYFLYTDAWNPTVIQLKYMTELLGIKVKIGGLWHAGSYDLQDGLGRLIGDAHWVRMAELSMFNCYTHNFFATEFHLNMFAMEMFSRPGFELKEINSSIRIVGWPMEYLPEVLAPFANTEKKNKIIFPHRIAPEKQLDIFKDLAAEMPEYEWFIAQEHKLSKDEYHTHLAESKVAFSANLQETLGISMYEAAVVGTLPLVPNRLSYSEMWDENGRYPSDWTTNFESYLKHKQLLVGKIRHVMEDYNNLHVLVKKNADTVGNKFFNGDALYKEIIEAQK